MKWLWRSKIPTAHVIPEERVIFHVLLSFSSQFLIYTLLFLLFLLANLLFFFLNVTEFYEFIVHFVVNKTV